MGEIPFLALVLLILLNPIICQISGFALSGVPRQCIGVSFTDMVIEGQQERISHVKVQISAGAHSAFGHSGTLRLCSVYKLVSTLSYLLSTS